MGFMKGARMSNARWSIRVSVTAVALVTVIGCQGATKNTNSTNSSAVETGSVKTFEAGSFDVAPELVSMPPPEYPQMARDSRVEGVVLVRLLVGVDGRTKDMFVIQSIPMLDGAAADAAWGAVFKPGLKDGEPVAVWVVIPMEFSLDK